MIDFSGDFGARAAHRLDQEIVIWLTTVRADGAPQPSPVWFLWADQELLIYSKPNAPKLRNIQGNPNVSLHFDSDGEGGDIVILAGEARIDEQRAVEREIDVRRRDLREQIAIEVRGALLDLASAREQVEAARERLRLAEQELAQSRERFRAGVAGNADVITASLALTGARTQLNDALAAFQGARVALARAEGSITDLP